MDVSNYINNTSTIKEIIIPLVSVILFAILSFVMKNKYNERQMDVYNYVSLWFFICTIIFIGVAGFKTYGYQKTMTINTEKQYSELCTVVQSNYDINLTTDDIHQMIVINNGSTFFESIFEPAPETNVHRMEIANKDTKVISTIYFNIEDDLLNFYTYNKSKDEYTVIPVKSKVK